MSFAPLLLSALVAVIRIEAVIVIAPEYNNNMQREVPTSWREITRHLGGDLGERAVSEGDLSLVGSFSIASTWLDLARRVTRRYRQTVRIHGTK